MVTPDGKLEADGLDVLGDVKSELHELRLLVSSSINTASVHRFMIEKRATGGTRE
jgi:hypothetical protein